MTKQWKKFATIGAKAGDNLLDSGGTSLGDNDFKNAAIALGISGTTLSLTNAGSGVTLAKGNVGLGNVDNTSDATILSGNLTGTVDGVAVTTVKNGAAAGATANQDSTSTIRAGTTAANVGLGNVTNESKATMFAGPTFTGTVSGVTKSHVGLGSVDNNSTATILGGNLTGQVNSVAVATVTSGAAAGATANQDSTATIRNGVTTFERDQGDIFWSNLSGNVTPTQTSFAITITWRNGSGTSLGTTVITLALATSTTLAAAQTTSNGASATVSLGGAANAGVIQSTTVTKNSVVCTLKAQVFDGSGWSFK